MNKSSYNYKLLKLLAVILCLTLVSCCTTYRNTSLMQLQQECSNGNRQAMEQFKHKAMQGNADAQLVLGFWYEYGQNVPVNNDTAIFWYKKALDHGFADAAFHLGLLCYRGQGMKKDIVQAYCWMLINSKLMKDENKPARLTIEKEMTPDQIGLANAMCLEWLKNHSATLPSSQPKVRYYSSCFQDSLIPDSISPNKRTRKSIIKVVNRNLGALQAVYNNRLRVKNGIRGKIVVKFAVDEFGKVVFCEVLEATTDDKELEASIVTAIKRWTFDKIENPKDVTEIVYPFFFSQ
jgi:TonB family protein